LLGRVRGEAERDPDDEWRVWYVAVTRVREMLLIVDGSVLAADASPWLRLVPG